MKRLVVVSAGLLMAAPAVAQQPEPAAPEPVHVVRPGDTLWELARRYLRDPYLWPEIFRENRDVVENPNRIFPRERLRIPGLEGYAAEGAETGPVAAAADRTVFFQQERAAGLTVLEREEAERTVLTPGDFYRAGRLIPERELRPVGQLAEVRSPSAVPMDIQPMIARYDRVFMPVAAGAQVRPGDRYHLVRPGRELQPFGRIFRPTGVATVEAVERGVATVVIEDMFDRVSVGDLAVPVPDFTVPAGVTPRPAVDVEGVLLALQEPQPVPAVLDQAFVDLGRASGVQEGDELEVVLPPERESWGIRPEVRVARLQVVRVTERTSAVRVVELWQPALRAGLPVRRVARMP